MPNKRRGRRNRTSTTPVPQTATTSSRSTTGANSSSTSSSSSSKSSPQTRTGRRTNNSQKGRQQLPSSATGRQTQAVGGGQGSSSATKRGTHSNGSASGRGGGNGGIKRKKPDYSLYTAEDQTVYKPGDYAYVDSQQSDQPYHICLVMGFKGTRKDTVTAEVKWFYRVCELPPAVYYQLMEDRKQSEDAAVFSLPSIRDRELFTAFNLDTHPAHFFRGKCSVKELGTITDLATYLPGENNFFYQHGYKPESRRMTKLDEFSFIPYSQQAVLPEYNSDKTQLLEGATNSPPLPSSTTQELKTSPTFTLDRYSTTSPMETLIWQPSNIEDDSLLMYLRAARSVALHAGVCMYGLMRDGYMAASSDETTQQAFDVLQNEEYDTEKALLDLIKKPIAGRLHKKRNWSKEHSLLFAKGMRQFGKNFLKIKKELLPNKEITELIEYYYYWKKTTAGLSSRSTRKQRKQFHIRMSRAMMKPDQTRTPEPEREFIDVSSGDEEDMEEDGEKCFSYHACRHCYSTESNSWHHSGSEKTILCQDCRLYFRKYSCMRPLTVKRDPPDFMFKDYHLALAEESGRKTRNSGNVRLPRAGLRNGKIFSKSDSDDEGSDTTDFSSTESIDLPNSTSNNMTTSNTAANNPSTSSSRKELQPRRSLLDLMDSKDAAITANNGAGHDDSSNMDKKENIIKKEDREYNTDEEGGSGPSTAAEEMEHDEMEEEGSRKSSEDHQSSSHSPESSGEERPLGPLSATTPSASAPLAKENLFPPELIGGVPQQFIRVRNDKEEGTTCARTDLVYVHPPPEERKALSQPQKAIPHHVPQLNFGTTTDQPSSAAPNTSHTHSKQVPTITTYEPHLPSGPGHFISFPLPHPLTPTYAFPPGIEPQFHVAMGTRQFPAQHMNREEMLLWQQQQQQQQQLLGMKQLEMMAAAAHHHTAGTAGTAFQSSHPPSTEHQMIFQFPSPEEIPRVTATHQRIPHQLHTPIPPDTAAASVVHGPPPHHHHQFHQLIAATPSVIMEAVQHHDDAGRQQAPLSLSLVQTGPAPPGNIETFQQQQLLQQHQQLLLQQQQQQQLMAAAVLTPEHIQELQRQYIMIMHEAQKNPDILNNPAAQNVIGQYKQIEQFILIQQQQQQELLLQQEIIKQQQQQQQQQQKYSNAPPSSANRPGVIMNIQK